ncbi:MAG: hypothetical protein J0L92_01170 [Deltaproteobacteria bacterium]|nr:hypothetical protein [Deltaproteobacteria bacterium]
MRLAVQLGSRVEATPGGRAACPGCAEPVVAKCGELVTWHWAHASGRTDCDPWWEPETPWHREWKSHAPLERQEVVRGSHRADVVLPDGYVIELQHSPISPEEIREREAFYGRMAWLFDARDAWSARRLMFPACGSCLGSGMYRHYDGHESNEYPCSACLRGSPPVPNGANDLSVWRWAKRGWLTATKPILIDCGPHLLRVVTMRGGSPTLFIARRCATAEIARWFATGDAPGAHREHPRQREHARAATGTGRQARHR